MRIVTWIVLALLLCLTANGCRKAQEKTAVTPEKLATEFVSTLTKGDFDSAVEKFDPTMSAAMPADKLRDTWQTLEKQAGPFQQQQGTHVEQVPQNGMMCQKVTITCRFAKGNVDVQVVYDDQQQVSGLWVAPSSQ